MGLRDLICAHVGVLDVRKFSNQWAVGDRFSCTHKYIHVIFTVSRTFTLSFLHCNFNDTHLKMKMSSLFHNTATLRPNAMCHKFKRQLECDSGHKFLSKNIRVQESSNRAWPVSDSHSVFFTEMGNTGFLPCFCSTCTPSRPHIR